MYHWTPKPKRIIDATELEYLFAEGLQQKDIAVILDFAPTVLSKKINNSASLSEAKRRGMEKAAISK